MGNGGSSDSNDECVDLIGPEPILSLDSCDVDPGAVYYIPGLCMKSSQYTNDMDADTYRIYLEKLNELGNVPGEWLESPNYPLFNEFTGSRRFTEPPFIFRCSADSCNKYKIHEDSGGIGASCCGNTSGIDGCSTTIPGWGCATFGMIVPAIRGNPLGDPLLCCFNDRDGTNNRTACYATKTNRNTCNKCQRDITSNGEQSVSITRYDPYGRVLRESLTPCTEVDKNPYYVNGKSIGTGCQDIAFSYCTGEDLPPNDTSWIYRWMTQDGRGKPYQLDSPSCHYALLRNIGVPSTEIQAQLDAPSTTGCYPQGLIASNPEDLRWSQRLLNSVIAKYRRQGYTLPAPINSPGYSLFQEYLKKNICCKYPIVCQQGLELACSNLDINTVSQDAELSDWCGCYMRPEEYENYVNNFGINESCTPPCNRSTSIKKVNADNTYVQCTQGVCIIDDVTINIANSSGGDVNFDQFCTGCDNGGCSCIVNDSTVELANSQFGQVSIENKCGKIECTDEYGNIHPCVEDTISTFWWNVIYIVIAIIIVLLFIVLCVYLITINSKKKQSRTVILKRKIPSDVVNAS